MKKRLLYTFIFVGILAQFGALISNIVLREVIVRDGTVHRFQAAPVDPFDVFRGRYVALNFKVFTEGFLSDFEISEEKWCYLQIGTDADGFSVIERLSQKNDVAPPYLKTRAWSSMIYEDEIEEDYEDEIEEDSEGKRHRVPTGKYRIYFTHLPFSRYYMPERLAPQAEEVYRQYQQEKESDEHNTVAVVRIWKGRAVIEDLEIDGRPIRKFLTKH